MFLFKKIVSQFFSPLSLTLELMLLGLILLYFTSKQKTGKAFVSAGTILLVLCSFTPLADMFINPLKEQYPSYIHDISLDADRMPKYVAVLGAGYDSVSSIPIASRIGYDSLVRLTEGIRVHRLIPSSKLILSGGSNPGTISSAEDMAQLAEELGVNVQDIIIEKISRDTKDEAEIIRTIVGNDRFILITSASHMPRSMALFTKLGMNPIPAPTRSIESRILHRGPDPFFPTSINIQKVEMAFHEYLGIIWAKMRGQI